MIWNIIDHRKRPYRWKRVLAIVEAIQHDNSCKDADQAPIDDSPAYVTFDERRNISVQDAVKWADGLEGPVTLYLWDREANR